MIRRAEACRRLRRVVVSSVCAGLLGISAVEPADAQVQSQFDPPTLVFHLTVHNPANRTQHLTAIVMRSVVRQGNFGCLSEGTELLPLARYPVEFHVADQETRAVLQPVLQLGPDQTIQIDVMAVPRDVGSCAGWSALVTPVLVFADGEKLEGAPATITDQFVASYNQRNVPINDLLAALAHTDPRLRARAIPRLATAELDPGSLRRLLEARLQDSDPHVRARAAAMAGQLGLNPLGSMVLQVLAGESPNTCTPEHAGVFQALVRLRPAGVEDSLVAYLFRESTCSAAAEALLELRSPRVPNLLRRRLTQNPRWARIGQDPARVQYRRVAETLVAYRDVRSVPILARAIIDPENDRQTALALLQYVSRMIPRDRLVRDAFLISFARAIQPAVNHPVREVRDQTRVLLSRIGAP